jgi:hypothetical protein
LPTTTIASLRRILFLPLAALTVLAVAACGLFRSPEPHVFCSGDDECGENQVCFPDGCGDPGKNIVVEVVPGASTGQFAQDFRIDALQPLQNLEAFEPAVILGAIQQEGTLSSDSVPYQGEVVFQAYGESIIIPGRKRWVHATITLDQGAYEVPMPTGAFTLTYTPKDERLPPQRREGQVVQPGQAVNVNLLLPNPASVLSTSGRLLRSAATNTPVTEAVMQVQAFEPESGLPYSQRVLVQQETGAFTLYLQPSLEMGRLIVRATPQDSTALVPSKDFDVPFSTTLPTPLELGDFAQPVPLSGRLVDASGDPVTGAAVLVEGMAGGGGTFRIPAVNTDQLGRFSSQVLPPFPGTKLTLWGLPNTRSTAGIVRSLVEVPLMGGDLGEVEAPDKVEVKGRILRPGGDGPPAAPVIVEAEPVAPIADLPLPQGVTRGDSDAEGRFLLRLDPAMYRLDFAPREPGLPQVSRFATVPAVPNATGQLEPVLLPDFTLSRGRRVTGMVSSIPRRLSTEPPAPAPNASVKFFRVVSVEGRQSSVLLAETLADENGNYSVILPTAQEGN